MEAPINFLDLSPILTTVRRVNKKGIWNCSRKQNTLKKKKSNGINLCVIIIQEKLSIFLIKSPSIIIEV